MKTETGNEMTANQMALRHNEVEEIESQLSTNDYLVGGGERYRVVDIYYLSTHGCITVVCDNGRKLSWDKIKKWTAAGNVSIVRCTQPSVETCDKCSLSNYGRDCTNNKI